MSQGVADCGERGLVAGELGCGLCVPAWNSVTLGSYLILQRLICEMGCPSSFMGGCWESRLESNDQIWM